VKQREWGFACLAEGNATAGCISGKAQAHGYTSSCSECISIHAACGLTNCLATCLVGGEKCDVCMFQHCHPANSNCTGFPGYVPAADLVIAPAADPNGETTYYVIPDIGEISFLDSVEKAWKGDAKLLAAAIVVFSGIEPYVENIVLFIAWFLPMVPERRRKLLESLAWFGRWSLVDVFIVVVLVIGLDFTIAGTVEIKARSATAISMFAVQNMWALAQGEWMLQRHHTLMQKQRQNQALPPITLSVSKGGVKHFLTKLSTLFVMSVLVAILTCISTFAPLMTFVIGEAEKSFGLSTIFGAVGVVDFPSIVAFLRVFLLPVGVSLGVMAAIGHSVIFKKEIHAQTLQLLYIVGHFCSLDVFLLAVVLIGNEFHKLIFYTAKSISPCVELDSEVRYEWGIYMMLPTALLIWVFWYAVGQRVQMERIRATNKSAKVQLADIPNAYADPRQVETPPKAAKASDNEDPKQTLLEPTNQEFKVMIQPKFTEENLPNIANLEVKETLLPNETPL